MATKNVTVANEGFFVWDSVLKKARLPGCGWHPGCGQLDAEAQLDTNDGQVCTACQSGLHTGLLLLMVFVDWMNDWKVLYRKRAALWDKVSTRSWHVLRWRLTVGLINGCMILESWSKKKRAWRHDLQGIPLGVTHAYRASCHRLRISFDPIASQACAESESD